MEEIYFLFSFKYNKEDNKDIIKSINVIEDKIDIIVSGDKKKMTPIPPHDKSNNNND